MKVQAVFALIEAQQGIVFQDMMQLQQKVAACRGVRSRRDELDVFDRKSYQSGSHVLRLKDKKIVSTM